MSTIDSKYEHYLMVFINVWYICHIAYNMEAIPHLFFLKWIWLI